MRWFYSFSWAEAIFVALALLVYGLYVWRQIRLARALQQSARSVLWKLPLRLLVVTLLLVALLGPAFGTTRKQLRSTGKDVWLLLDLSRSMNATDIRPSRLERAKAALPGLLQQIGADRVGLIAFAGEAEMRCPLTYDANAVLLFARALKTSQLTTPGTNLEAALNLVRARTAAEASRQSATAPPRTTVAVLLTDGEDFGGSLRENLTALRRDNIRVYALGVGTPEGAPVPGGRRNQAPDAQGHTSGPPITQLRTSELQQLTSETRGQYFEMTPRVDETRELGTAVAGVRGEVRELRLLEVAANKYQYPLVLALALLVVEVLVTVRVFRLDA